MRRVEVTAPEGKGVDIARIAFSCGIGEVSVAEKTIHKADAAPEKKHVVDMNVSTPHAKAFIGALFQAPFFNRHDYAIGIREPRAILTRESRREATRPLAVPILDIDEELWQFSHITVSFVARIFIAGLLLAYGMVENNVLLMAAALIFLPFMPLILAVALGALTRQWGLVTQGAVAWLVATLIIVCAGVLVALAADPPMLFSDFPPMWVGVALSAAVGIAAAFATGDDAGHRQLVGLAAASQLALLPAWFGVSIIFGFTEDVTEKLLSFGANTLALIAAALIVYGYFSARAEAPRPREARHMHDESEISATERA